MGEAKVPGGPTSTDGLRLRPQLWSSLTLNAQGQRPLRPHGGLKAERGPGLDQVGSDRTRKPQVPFFGSTPPFLYPICLWNPIFLFLHPACFPDPLAPQDSIISALRLEVRGDELEPGTQARADEKLLGSVPGAQQVPVTPVHGAKAHDLLGRPSHSEELTFWAPGWSCWRGSVSAPLNTSPCFCLVASLFPSSQGGRATSLSFRAWSLLITALRAPGTVPAAQTSLENVVA